jgi:hypothetical protein
MRALLDERMRARFNSPDWSFIIGSTLLSLFLFASLQPIWQHDNFALTDWPQADGQFNYRLALNPFTKQPTEHGITLDRPAARQQRILYPLVVWLAAFGSARFVPALLIFSNYFALCLLGWLGGVYAQTLNRHALWGVLLPLYPGWLTVLRCDSPEILEVCLLLASLLCLQRKRHAIATLLLALALLTKETALLAALAAAFVYCVARWRRREPSIRWFYFAVPLAVFALWQAVLFYLWDTLAIGNDRREIGLPFVGFLRLFGSAVRQQAPMPRGTLIELSLIVGFALLVLLQLRTTVAAAFVRAAWALYAGWAFALNVHVWNTDWNFLRACAEFYLLGALITIGGRAPIKLVLGASIISLWLWQAYRLLEHIP